MPPLEIVRLTLLVAHFVGLAAVIGPFLLQLRREAPTLRLALAGAVVQILTGNALIASVRLQGIEVDEAKMIVKVGVAVMVVGLLLAAMLVRRRVPNTPAVRPLFRSAGGLALANVIIAVVWT